jgi:hypothetical protein
MTFVRKILIYKAKISRDLILVATPRRAAACNLLSTKARKGSRRWGWGLLEKRFIFSSRCESGEGQQKRDGGKAIP